MTSNGAVPNLPGDCIFMENNRDYEDLFLMAACDEHIVANSTFFVVGCLDRRWPCGSSLANGARPFPDIEPRLVMANCVVIDVPADVKRGIALMEPGPSSDCGHWRHRVPRPARSGASSREAGAKVIGVGSADYDLRSRGGDRAPLGRRGTDGVVHLAADNRGDRGEPGRAGHLLLRQRDHGRLSCSRHAVSHEIDKVVVAGTVCSYPEVHAAPRFVKRICGTGTPKRQTHPTDSPRRCCSCSPRPTANNLG